MSCEAYIVLVEVENAMARLMAAVLNGKLLYMQRNGMLTSSGVTR